MLIYLVLSRVVFGLFAITNRRKEATPKQLFDNPRREKIRAFIHKLKNFAYHIDRRDFDLMQMFVSGRADVVFGMKTGYKLDGNGLEIPARR